MLIGEGLGQPYAVCVSQSHIWHGNKPCEIVADG